MLISFLGSSVGRAVDC